MGAEARLVAAALAGACLAVAGCGYSAPSEAENVEATVRTFVQSCAQDRPERAGEMLTEQLRSAFYARGSTARSCAAYLGIPPAAVSESELSQRFRQLSVTGLTLNREKARVRVTGPDGARATLGLARTAGEWLVDTPPGEA